MSRSLIPTNTFDNRLMLAEVIAQESEGNIRPGGSARFALDLLFDIVGKYYDTEEETAEAIAQAFEACARSVRDVYLQKGGQQ